VSINVHALHGLARASRVLERTSSDLSLAQYRVLASVGDGEERAARIAARLALGKPTISATVDSLTQRGLLTRTEVQADQRAAALALTAEGRATLDAVEKDMWQRLQWLAGRTENPTAVIEALAALDKAVDEFLAQR
jgi:DNA-binding MarR family transcriptional regulator